MDAHMLAKVLRRAGDRVARGWAQYHPQRLHGDRVETGCLLQHLGYAYRDITGEPVAMNALDHRRLLLALRAAVPALNLVGIGRWNDAAERTWEEAAQACYDAAAQVEVSHG